MRAAFSLFVCFLTFATAATGIAQGTDTVLAEPDEADERAANHFRAGTSYLREERYDEALREFREAYRLSERSEMLFNIGVCLAHLGRHRSAARAYERFIDETLDVDSRREAEVRRDASLERADEEGLPAEAMNPWDRPPEEDPPPQIIVESSFDPAPWIVIGASVIVGVGALVIGLVSHGIHSSLVDACTNDVCPADRMDDRDTGNNLAMVSTVLTFVALAGAAVGVVWLLLSRSASEDEAVAVTVAPTPTGVAATLSASF